METEIAVLLKFHKVCKDTQTRVFIFAGRTKNGHSAINAAASRYGSLYWGKGGTQGWVCALPVRVMDGRDNGFNGSPTLTLKTYLAHPAPCGGEITAHVVRRRRLHVHVDRPVSIHEAAADLPV